VGPLLLAATELALRAAALTDGDVDPTVGRALELAGYDRDWSLLAPADGRPLPAPASTARVHARVRPGWRGVRVDRAGGAIVLPPGVRLDLGATAKAWAADRAAQAAACAAGCATLVSLGGDVATAGDAPPGGWLIHVTDDHRSDPSVPGQTVSITGGGLATSSTAVRRWRHAGRTMHHIIDPRTGSPARGPWQTVSVAAASCADANIATTAALVRGESAADWLASLGLPARLAGADGAVLALCGWPGERLGAARAPRVRERSREGARGRPAPARLVSA
jgi:thiamine biosynthesis lipoprotein